MIGTYRGAFIALLVAAAGAAASGCSGSGDELPREPVSGTVTLDNQPLASGMIQFTPVDDKMGVGGGAPIGGGKFTISRESGLVPGSYRVAIFAGGHGGDAAKGASPEGRGKERSAKANETIPAKYNAQSELKADIKKGGANDGLKFDLQSK